MVTKRKIAIALKKNFCLLQSPSFNRVLQLNLRLGVPPRVSCVSIPMVQAQISSNPVLNGLVFIGGVCRW